MARGGKEEQREMEERKEGTTQKKNGVTRGPLGGF